MSVLNRAEYCRRQNLSYHALTYWHRRLGQISSLSTTLVPVPVEKIFRPPASSHGAGVRIILNNSVAIEVTEDFFPSALQQVLFTLEQRYCFGNL